MTQSSDLAGRRDSASPNGQGKHGYGRPKSKGVRAFGEASVVGSLIFCGIFSLITTIAIVYTLAGEGSRFFSGVEGRFEGVSFWEFISGLQWSPLLGGEKKFGIWPLITGTAMVTAVAMLVAGPLGLITAIWLSEYAPIRVRNVLKPVLEVIAGVPTVVLGFFALTVITPTLQMAFIQVPSYDASGVALIGSDGNAVTEPLNLFGIEIYNVLSAGIAVGILTLPIITSLTEDALRAVPKPLREASYGLGSTRFETSVKVVFPAALSGIVAAFLLAIARCVGETMIVALAAGGSVVPLHQMVNPPTVVQIWHEQGDPTGTEAVASVEAGQVYSLPTIRLRDEEKVDELELLIAPTSTATAVEFALRGESGNAIATGRLAVDPTIKVNDSIEVDWEIPRTDTVGDAPDHEEARPYGARLQAGRYTVDLKPIDGALAITYVNLDGERFMSAAERAGIPLDVRKSMQPMTGYLVNIFLGDVSNLGIEYYSSYAVAGMLFLITFILTIVGHIIRVRFQQQYE
jgi:phosphate transport system permease protein